MNLKRIGSKVKGFTLVEIIVVMAIIAILAGIVSTLIGGFQRNARLEDNNNKAQMVYTGMQNQLIQCEINQDRSLLDADAKGGNSSNDNYKNDDMVYVELYFEMTQGKVGDHIYVASTYKTQSAKKDYADRNSVVTSEKKWYAGLEEMILSFVDNSFEGFCAVYIDYEDYLVDSVIYLEPGASQGVDMTSYSTSSNGIGQYMHELNPYAPYTKGAGETNNNKKYRMLTSIGAQEKCMDTEGIYFGAYPTLNAKVE
ncbi:MAG: prepilin-type N-terminal cleavage/methylation domain-containing protein [Ruminococcus sp.]|nr:prepilin-type N-terminal cleavage/methylation domain-containing protein [Ruminococcus sp.]MBR4096415.1 prepilin-type N-terminal cleavage/methylation domain-containing protein [Oscillospiraceae bacterium]